MSRTTAGSARSIAGPIPSESRRRPRFAVRPRLFLASISRSASERRRSRATVENSASPSPASSRCSRRRLRQTPNLSTAARMAKFERDVIVGSIVLDAHNDSYGADADLCATTNAIAVCLRETFRARFHPGRRKAIRSDMTARPGRPRSRLRFRGAVGDLADAREDAYRERVRRSALRALWPLDRDETQASTDKLVLQKPRPLLCSLTNQAVSSSEDIVGFDLPANVVVKRENAVVSLNC